ncbi:MAG: hypothetical protein V1672_02535 [Candidatus Diapherotrites archaeon]
MDKRLIIRLLLLPVFLYIFYTLGFSLEAIAILGSFFVVIILLRGKIWETAERTIEKYLPFTKSWPEWAQKVLLVIFFVLIYYSFKQILFFILMLFGIDLQEIMMASYGLE